MKYVFYVSLLIAIIFNSYFGMYKEMYSWMYSEAINGLCMIILIGASTLELYLKKKTKRVKQKTTG